MKKIALTMMCLAALVLMGCQLVSQEPDPNETEQYDLRILLPSEAGFLWHYDGFAEYGHEMTLEGIETESQNDAVVYTVSGEVMDVSDGEGGGDYSLQLTYTVVDGKLIQSHRAPRMMDTAYNEIILIQNPLEEGAIWTQTVQTDINSSPVELQCEITEISLKNEKKKYTVVYANPDGQNYEKRTIEEGQGVTSYAKTLPIGDNGSLIEVGYMLTMTNK